MTERINTPFTNEHFAAFCLGMVGQPYWYGTVVYKCTENLRSRKAAQYPSHYASSRTARYRQDIENKKVCADCVGGCKGYAWTDGGKGVLDAIGTDNVFASKYGANGCPDKSANGMFSYAKSKGMDWGTLDTLSDIVGLALHKDGHVGYTVGGGYAVEWQGFNSGCVKTKIAGRGWTSWFKLPFIDYNDGRGSPEDVRKELFIFGKDLIEQRNHLALEIGSHINDVESLTAQLAHSLKITGLHGSFAVTAKTDYFSNNDTVNGIGLCLADIHAA